MGGRAAADPPRSGGGVFVQQRLLWSRCDEVVGAEGLEPPTVGLKGHCSAVELRPLSIGCFDTRILPA